MKNIIYAFFLSLFFFPSSMLLQGQQLLIHPYLVEPGRTDMVIRWETDKKVDCRVEFGFDSLKTGSYEAGLRGEKEGGFLYEAELTELKPGTPYYYRVEYGGKKTSWYRFVTDFADKNDFKFAVMGDSRSHPEIFSRIMELTGEYSPSLIISMGDLVAHGEAYPEWSKYYFDIVKNIACSIPIVSTLGDHETAYKGKNGGELFRYFLRKDEPMDRQYFSFDYGNAHFVSLDYRYPDNGEMVDWFVRDMSASQAKWTFVYMHRPCYNMGGHRSDWGRGVWPALFEKYRVDLVFAGHSHLYERFQPTVSSKKNLDQVVTHITTGGAGAGLYDVVQNPVLAVSESVNHFLIIEIKNDSLKLKAERIDGTTLDNLVIVKKNGQYDENYLRSVIAREKLELITGFNSEISRGAPQIPLRSYPLKLKLHFSSPVSEDIPFTISLSDESKKTYEMEDVSGEIPSGSSKEAMLKIYRYRDVKLNKWGEYFPELRLQMIYRYHSHSDTLTGGPVEYDPE